MIKIIFFFVLSIYSVFANAATWVILKTYTDNSVNFFDFDTVNKSNNKVTLWVKRVYDENAPGEGEVYSVAEKHLYSCRKRTQLILTTDSYNKESKLISTYKSPSNMVGSEVVPDTVGEEMLKEVCAINFPSKEFIIRKSFYYGTNDIYGFAKKYFEDKKALKDDQAPH